MLVVLYIIRCHRYLKRPIFQRLRFIQSYPPSQCVYNRKNPEHVNIGTIIELIHYINYQELLICLMIHEVAHTSKDSLIIPLSVTILSAIGCDDITKFFDVANYI